MPPIDLYLSSDFNHIGNHAFQSLEISLHHGCESQDTPISSYLLQDKRCLMLPQIFTQICWLLLKYFCQKYVSRNIQFHQSQFHIFLRYQICFTWNKIQLKLKRIFLKITPEKLMIFCNSVWSFNKNGNKYFLFQTFCTVSRRFQKPFLQRFSASSSLFLFPPWNCVSLYTWSIL